MIATRAIGRDGLLPREDDLVARFGKSRTIVREATKTLQALGIVVTRPRIGSKIQPLLCWRLLDPQVMDWITDAKLTAELARDLLELRSMIEPAAAALAAKRASPEQRATLAKAVAAMGAASSFASHLRADFAFHEAILDASGNAFLLQLKPALHAVLKGSFTLSMYSKTRMRASVAIHQTVAKAILERDVEGARLATIAMLDVARADIERHNRKSASLPSGGRENRPWPKLKPDDLPERQGDRRKKGNQQKADAAGEHKWPALAEHLARRHLGD